MSDSALASDGRLTQSETVTPTNHDRTRRSPSGFAVLGAPDPGLPPAYRGTSRELPLVRDDLGLDHPANRALLDLLERHDATGIDLSYDLALRLFTGYRGIGIGRFELLEVTGKGQQPQLGEDLLGFDVSFPDGGTESLLAMLLLYQSPFGESVDATTEGRLSPLRERFRTRLNEHLLFATEVDATEFLSAAEAVGPWEGPEVVWEVAGLWFVSDDPLAARSSAIPQSKSSGS